MMRQSLLRAVIAALMVLGLSGLAHAGAPAGPPKAAALDVNTATAAQLTTVKGVGAKTADKIIAARAAQPFTSLDEMTRVKGIGDKTVQRFKEAGWTAVTAPVKKKKGGS